MNTLRTVATFISSFSAISLIIFSCVIVKNNHSSQLHEFVYRIIS
uniref:Acidic phosphoprotein-like protein n=1 Tax=Siphoviridae sp. ctCIv11 TaxID=2827806 RepID=A0A8S5S358_9CAUD|nr:MAG TPA: acidic phosphoprotein precursor-like protein [Siphoviridae sp. ctCIv11]